MLRRQSLADFEAIVVDDGSDWGDQIIRRYDGLLQLRYLWRPNDGSPARSRNAGARAARGEGLVFFDGDMLPNPQALASYARCLAEAPEAVVYGYTGNTGLCFSPSIWFPAIRVMAYDARFCFRSATEMVYERALLETPQRFAWSGSFALTADLFAASGGFDESFSGWGFEDTEFAERLVQRDIRLDFCLDAWCENQVHSQRWRVRDPEKNAARLGTFTPVRQPPRLVYHPAASRLGALLAEYYVPRMAPHKPEAWR